MTTPLSHVQAVEEAQAGNLREQWDFMDSLAATNEQSSLGGPLSPDSNGHHSSGQGNRHRATFFLSSGVLLKVVGRGVGEGAEECGQAGVIGRFRKQLLQVLWAVAETSGEVVAMWKLLWSMCSLRS